LYNSGGKRAETGIAIVVHKSTMRSVVTKTVCNESRNALKIKQKWLSISFVQEYMPTLVHKDGKMEELYLTTKEILEQDGKGEINTITMLEWNSVVVDKSY
jgi:polygalacturonase